MQQLEFLLAPHFGGPPGGARGGPRGAKTAETLCALRLEGETVPYLLQRSRRRSMGLTVDTGGLHIAAPRHAPLAEIESFAREHRKWILRKLKEWARYRETLPRPWRMGEPLPFLGAPLETRFEPSLVGARRNGDALEIGPEPLDALTEWLKGEAYPLFSERVSLHAPRLGVATPRLALSNAQTRWGTCTESGRITLNWRLVHFRLAVIDYVVVHELAHLIKMNHSRQFWTLVGSVLPEYEAAKAELKARTRELPDL